MSSKSEPNLEDSCMNKSTQALDILSSDVIATSTFQNINVIGCILKAFHNRKSNQEKKLEKYAFRFEIENASPFIKFLKVKVGSEVLKRNSLPLLYVHVSKYM